MIPPGRSSVKENIEGTADPAFSVYKPLTLNCILYTINVRKEGMNMSFGELALKLGMLLVFFGIMVYVGFYCRKHSTDVNGFVLGGRSVGPWLTAFAYGTSYFSAVVFVGYAGQFGWRYGIASTWIGIANAFLGSLLAWSVLGRRTRIMTQHLKSKTMPQFFETRFDSKSLKILASLIIFIFLIPYTASLYNGLSRLFAMAFPVPYELCVIIMAVLTAIYVIAGGYMATAINDFIQGLIMIVGIVAVIGAVLNSQGGFTEALNKLAQVSDPAVSGTPGIFNSFFGPDPLNLFGVMILTSLGTWGLPQMIQKFYAIRSERAITKGMVVSTVFACIIAGGCYFLGGFGRLFSNVVGVMENGTPVGGFDAVIPSMLSTLSPFLIAVVVILVLSASMSTLSSLVLTSSSTITLDFLKPYSKKEMDEKRQLLIMRVLIAVFIIISAALAILQYNSGIAFIAQAMGISWGAMAGAFLAPFLYGLYWKRTSTASCWVSILFSTIFMTVDMLVNLKVLSLDLGILASPINAGAFCMIAGLILVPLVSLVTPSPDKAKIEQIFSCYNRKLTIQAKYALEADDE